MSGGGGGGTQTTVQKADPWAGVQPFLKKGYAEGDRLFQQGGPDYYPGQTYVSRDPMENFGARKAMEFGVNDGARQFNLLRDQQDAMFDAVDVANNPYVNGMLNTAYGRLDDNFQNNVATNLRDQAFSAGHLGQEGHALAYGQAAGDLEQAKADMAAQIYSNAYDQGLDERARGVAMNSAVNQAGLMPSQAMSLFGEYNRGERELALQADMDRFNYNEQRPYTNLNNYMALMNGAPWNNTSTQSVQGGSGNRAANAVGGGLAGYGMFGPISGALTAAGPPTAAASALLGLGPLGFGLGGALLGGLFS